MLALFLFSFLPPVLAHAGLATTDMALTAFLGAAFLSGMIWLEEPTLAARRAGSALATGLAMLSKFSSLAFLPVAAGVALALVFCRRAAGRRRRGARRGRPASAIRACRAGGLPDGVGRLPFLRSPGALPAPELYAGIRQVLAHNAEGHPGYLLGYTPHHRLLVFLRSGPGGEDAAGIPGADGLRHRAGLPQTGAAPAVRAVLLSPPAILLVGALQPHQYRHPPRAARLYRIFAAGRRGRATPARKRRQAPRNPAALALLLAWYAGSSLLSHPDYLPYFNLLAGSQPEKILVDSDLDWGQDMKRLAARLRQENAPSVAFVTSLVADLPGEFGFPPVRGFRPAVPDPGWNAVSVSKWKEERFGLGDTYLNVPLWPDKLMDMQGQPNVPQPERIGKGILLWYFPPR